MAESEDTVSLTARQREKATELLDQVTNGEIEVPGDIVDDWEYYEKDYDYEELLEQPEEEFTRQRAHAPVSDIGGTTHDKIEMMDGGLERALCLLRSGEYKVEPRRPPKLEKLGDKYYVSVDGHHRVTAFKALGLETMYIEYVDVPIP